MNSKNLFFPPALMLGTFAAALLIALLLVDFSASRQNELAQAKKLVAQHDRMFAEHVARSLDSIEVLLDEMRIAIQEGDRWQNWSSAVGHQRLKERLSRVLPQIRHLLIFDAEGYQRHTSFAEQPQMINVRDRPYFRALEGGAERSQYGPYIGRNSNRPTYAFARRLGSSKHFSGALMIAIEPDYFEQHCRSSRPYGSFEAGLVNAEGKVVALCRSLTWPASQKADTLPDFREVMAEGDFANMPLNMNRNQIEGTRYLLAVEPVSGYPNLRIVSVTPTSLLTGNWQKNAYRILSFGLFAIAILIAAGLLIRRQLKQLSALTTELKASHDSLENRVQEATQELNYRRSEAERLAQSKSRFFAAASHDLRQPLHALQLFLADLSRISNAPEERVLIERIDTAARAMASQLRSLLDISRLDMDSITPERKEISVKRLFEQLASTFQPMAAAVGVRLLFRASDTKLETDEALLTRLLGNLIDNAIKFSDSGSVLVCTRRRPNGIRIEVRDNGEGIAPANQAAVFDEFYQVANRARTQDAGLGLGLAISHRIACLLGTSISLRSREGQGSTFSLTLPCTSGQSTPDMPDETQLPTLVLIGEPGNFAERATRWGYTVKIAEDIPRAWRLLEAERAIPVVNQPGNCVLPNEVQSLLRQHPGVVITSAECELPEIGVYQLREPVKPARLRALLRSLH